MCNTTAMTPLHKHVHDVTSFFSSFGKGLEILFGLVVVPSACHPRPSSNKFYGGVTAKKEEAVIDKV